MGSLIPTRAAGDIESGLAAYLTTSFALSDTGTAQQLSEFLLDPEDGMFRGPYVRTRLPYAPAKDWEGVLSWLPSWFTPYRHQAEAFARLSSLGPDGPKRPDPTLVVTGTGSGKTESFLFPVLDHCKRNPGTGIKAVILYPMNALAADQERRLAKLIADNPELAGVTAGLYTGEVASGGRTRVSEKGLITDRDVMRDTPPDILLTNYKMLDQLLLREADRSLWAKSAQTLQYLVLDEFHTYDAAQGTDVAMLLRRLGLMLRAHQEEGFLSEEDQARPLGKVTPVATSATLGGGNSDGAQAMVDFAYTVFGEKMGTDAIVGETLLSVNQWQGTIPELTGKPLAPATVTPGVDEVETIIGKLEGLVSEGRDYSEAVHQVVCEELLGCATDTESAIAAMATNETVIAILEHAATALPLEHADTLPGGHVTVDPLVKHVFVEPSVRRNLEGKAAEFVAIVLSELAYLRAQFGAARGWDGKKIPGVETHLWVREISRIDRLVGDGGEEDFIFRWSDDGTTSNAQAQLEDQADHKWLPAIYCRHCGRSGWMTQLTPGEDFIETAVQKIRRGAFEDPKRQRPLIDATREEAAGVHRTPDGTSAVRWLNMDLLALSSTAPDDETRETAAVVPVLMYTGDDIAERADQETCPSCGEADAIRYLGSSVATLLSVALSNLFGMDELDNAEKKTLVFADSVQDAAHRAGFIQNRARAFALRARIHHAVTEILGSAEAEATLNEIADVMIAHAKSEPTQAEKERALYELLPPELATAPQFRGVWEHGTSRNDRDRAMRAMKHRLNLDLALQFGDRVDLPRSLVSTGTLTTAVKVSDEELLGAARQVIMATGDDELLAWARGVLEKMRIEGGIHHPWLAEYLKNDCNPYLLNRRKARAKGIPAFPRGGTPAFPRSGAALKGAKGKRNNNASMSLGSSQGWYARWTAQVLGIAAGSAFNAANLVTALFNELELVGIVGSVPTTTAGRVYYLAPEMISIRKEQDPEVLECSVCHSRVGVDVLARDAMEGVSCFNLDCEGTLRTVPVEKNYYSNLYQSTNTRTVVAAEHTGLVPTAQRKQVEDQFKAPADKQAADSPNVLVATPTLEMGIDIGDLSTVMLASMPTSVASYVQRIGRAGRLSGNSLIIALVKGRGRALTKLEHPLETIAGSVTAPAAYLSARDIMHRQFTAYLFDSHDIANQVGALGSAYDLFNSLGHTALDELTAIVEAGIGPDLAAFCGVLASHASSEVLGELRAWATDSNGLVADIANARRRWNETQFELLKRLNVLEVREQELEARVNAINTEDDELQHEYQATRASHRFTQKQLNAHKSEYWISALERYGLLPNFTLLDETVEFHLSVSTFNDVIQEFETEALQYSRGISSALVELAPGNTFYVQGVAAKIDTVDLGSEQSAIVHWRVCPACSYSEESTDDAAGAGPCPNCKAPGFADRAQLIAVVEMNKVSATVDKSRSTINDFDEDRRQVRYETLLTYSVPEGGRGQRWFLESSGFGMEYLPHVDMRWLNLGRMGSGNKIMAASQDLEAPLFRVCEHCGHEDKEAGANHWSDHHPWCRHRNAMEEHSTTFALGRKLSTQGVLVHLPALLSVMESSTLPSLLAALKLGFREYLGGNPDHLDIAVVSDVADGDVTDMLLIHDTVPGGTGYLPQFTDPAEIRAMFTVAYRHLVNCSCAQESRRACPSCLLPLVPERLIPYLSREAAVTALAKILTDDMHVGGEANPLEATWDGRITTEQPKRSSQSKLEERFIEQFRTDLKEMRATITDTVVNNHAHWTIRFPGSPHTWVLREQVHLGNTVPDILLETEDPDVRDIAIYLDGEAFHAHGPNQRIADDFRKRNSLYERGYLPWSMTWGDIDRRQAVIRNMEAAAPIWSNSAVEAALAEHLNISATNMELARRDPISQLLAMLSDPTQPWATLGDAAFTTAIYGGEAANGLLHRTYLGAVDISYQTAPHNHYGVTLFLDGTEVDSAAWQTFLGLTNLAYLNDRCAVVKVVERGQEATTAPGVDDVGASVVAEEHSAVAELSGVWQDIAGEFADEPDVLACLTALCAAGASEPDPDSIGEEIGGLGIIARWPALGALLVFDGDGEEFTEGDFAIVEASFGPDPSSIPPGVRAALHLEEHDNGSRR